MDWEQFVKPLAVGAGVVLGVAFLTPFVAPIPYMDTVLIAGKLNLGQLVVAGVSAGVVDFIADKYVK